MKAKRPRNISIGNQKFSDIRARNLFYVDKTDFIRQWWESDDPITLIARPRRFGKTLNMQMLESFFSVEYEGRADLFEGLEIWKHEKYRKLQGTIPVISLTFSDIKNDTFEGALSGICDCISDEYDSKSYLLESDALSENDKQIFSSTISSLSEMNQTAAERSLKKLCKWLKRYHGTSPIVLLDEYDAPMQEAWAHGYWDEMCTFMRSFMNATFKSNPAIARGLLTGVTRVSRESIFSGLNNLKVVSTLTKKYETCFGFTESEVFAALDEMGMKDKKQEAKKWYDGFRFGNVEGIYNPWSITNYLDEGETGLYWANTASTDLIDELIKKGCPEIKQGIETLMEGGAIKTEVDEQIAFCDLSSDDAQSVWSLLLVSGYLKVQKPISQQDREQGNYKCCLALTNFEIYLLFKHMIKRWFGKGGPKVAYNQFVTCLLASDIEGMEDFLNRISASTFSFFDVGSKNGSVQQNNGISAPERFYHGFVLGLLVDLRDRYELTSNRESGFGRYDVMLKPLNDTDPAYVLEFKAHNPRREKSLEDTLQTARDQIEKRNYSATLQAAGIEKERIHELGIAFQGKKCIIG